MAAHEEIRASLYRKLHELVGREEAAALMPPIAWEQVATKADLAELRGELFEKFGTLEAKIGALDGKIDGKIGTLDGRIRAQTWKMFSASFVSSFSTAGLVFAVLHFG